MPTNLPTMITIEFDSIPPDKESDARIIVEEAIKEAALLADVDINMEIGFEQRSPILATVATIVATLKLPFNDIPDLATSMKKLITFLREKLITQVDFRTVIIKTEIGEINIKIKPTETMHLEIGDIEVILKKK